MLKENGLRDQVKVLVGGAPLSEEWARKVGADGYAPDAIAAVKKAKSLLGLLYGHEERTCMRCYLSPLQKTTCR
jgi:hypothetical protein